MNAPTRFTASAPTEATVILTRPISVNNIYQNKRNGKGRVKSDSYKTWQRHAKNVMMAGGPRPAFPGPVSIRLFIPEQGVADSMDTDNTSKAYLDLLVHMGVITDDSRKIVRSLHLEWIDSAEGFAIITAREA